DTPTDGGVITNDIPPGTFSISEATDNVKASIVKTSETIGTIKIGFVSANNYAYSLTYTVEDSETDETKKITAEDFQVADNVLTAKDSVADKMKQVDSSTTPAEKTITINFTFTADDKTLNPNTQTLSIEVKLTHAQEVTAGETGIQFLIDGLKEMGDILLYSDASDASKEVNFSYNTYDKNGNYYLYKNNDYADVFEYDAKSLADKFITKFKKLSNKGYFTDVIFNNDIKAVENDQNSITFSVKLVMTETYEMADNNITLKFENSMSGATWVLPTE
ncbi:hypothetical protein, partial [Brachyspira catarrhinii]|uniref:hypothetical protein n=1 Tax=Brachyspira catarrhinii TaxID=2528966 RepID=UPI001387358F